MKCKILLLLFIFFLNLPLLAQEHIRKTWEGTYRHNQRLGRHYINTDSVGNNSWVWQPLERGGVLYIVHGSGNKVKILNQP